MWNESLIRQQDRSVCSVVRRGISVARKRGCSRGGCAEEWGGERVRVEVVERGKGTTGVLAKADE